MVRENFDFKFVTNFSVGFSDYIVCSSVLGLNNKSQTTQNISSEKHFDAFWLTFNPGLAFTTRPCSGVYSRRFADGLARDWNVCASYAHAQFTRKLKRPPKYDLKERFRKLPKKHKVADVLSLSSAFVIFHLNGLELDACVQKACMTKPHAYSSGGVWFTWPLNSFTAKFLRYGERGTQGC